MNYKSWKTNKLVPKNESLQVLGNELQVLENKQTSPKNEWLQVFQNKLQVLENKLVLENEWLQVLKNKLQVLENKQTSPGKHKITSTQKRTTCPREQKAIWYKCGWWEFGGVVA